MSPKQIFTLILAVTAFTAQIAFAAGPPSNVQNIQAILSGRGMTVTWAPVTEAKFYRIYYSNESILGHQGNYDDYEQTTTNDVVYTFTKLPLSSQEIFVSVLAINAEGTESEGFETEASVRIAASSIASSVPTTISSSSSSVAAEPAVMPQGEFPTTTAEPMMIGAVSALSSTGVLIVFTKNIQENAIMSPVFFGVTNSGGVALSITSVFINGQTVLLTTETQTPEREYRFQLRLPVPAGDGTHAIPSGQDISFRGFGLAPTEPDVPYGQNPMLIPSLPVKTAPNPLQANITPTPATDLPDSGVGLLGVLTLAGAGAGLRLRRRTLKTV